MRLVAVTLAAVLALTGAAPAQEDALGVPGPITFEAETFELAWTSNPSPTYFKQEYLPEGEAPESYSQMFIVEAVTQGPTPQQAAEAMMESLDERKAEDPMVNHALIANETTGEMVLDFILSATGPDGERVVEWNAYRYVRLGDGVALYAISRRGYGDGIETFLWELNNWRETTVHALATMDVPELTVE
jgi:hypothetical protein